MQARSLSEKRFDRQVGISRVNILGVIVEAIKFGGWCATGQLTYFGTPWMAMQVRNAYIKNIYVFIDSYQIVRQQ